MTTAASSLSPADRESLAALLYPDATEDLGAIVGRYPPRELPEGALVTRFAPSPTGFIHIGSLMASLLNWKLAQQTGGVFILRIEDTDRRREIEGGIEMIVKALTDAGLRPSEGPIPSGGRAQTGAHGPYLQSERLGIYHAYARDFVRRGLAYPCFLGEEQLKEIREQQTAAKAPIGVYGEWARFRDAPVADVEARLSRGEKFVLRLRSTATEGQRIEFHDRIRGKLELPANPLDTVALKSDGFPTYHFAHPIDDTLMGISVIIRGDEWISTTPIHLQIFAGMGVTPPPIAHIAPVAKQDGDSRRKLSKRLDAEASMDFYHQAGYPSGSIIEYLLNLLDSSFEGWRGEHPDRPFSEFTLSLDNLGRASSLFDLAKLSNVSRDVVARLSNDELVAAVQRWAERHEPRLATILAADPDYTRRALTIGRDDEPPRKDISMWRDVPERYAFFFAELFGELAPACYAEMPELARDEIARVLRYFADDLPTSMAGPTDQWFPRVKAYALDNGYAKSKGAMNKQPEAFKGLVGDFVMVARVAITGSRRSPDLPAVMKILGEAEVRARLDRAIAWASEGP